MRETDHTADAGAEITGATVEDVFQGAIEALYSILGLSAGGGCIRPSVPVEIHARGRRLDETLVAFLNEVLFTLDTCGLILPVECTVNITRDTGGFTVRAGGAGDKYCRDRHGPLREVKAATLHDLDVTTFEGGIRARVVFDV